MDPFNTVDFARLRFDTSNIMKRLRKKCESDIEDLNLSLDDKKKALEEKIDATALASLLLMVRLQVPWIFPSAL